MRRASLALSIALLASVSPHDLIYAQSPPVAPKPNDTAPSSIPEARDNKACAPQERLATGPDGKPQAGDATTASGTTLSDKLAKTDGVLCPPSNTNPAMAVPPPQTGSAMPVIPPPGSPGGDQSVQPK